MCLECRAILSVYVALRKGIQCRELEEAEVLVRMDRQSLQRNGRLAAVPWAVNKLLTEFFDKRMWLI